MAYQLMVDLFILPLVRMHKRLRFTRLALFLPDVDPGNTGAHNKQLLNASKKAVRAIYRKRGSAAVDRLEDGSVLEAFFATGKLVAWAVHRRYNSDDEKWVAILEREFK